MRAELTHEEEKKRDEAYMAELRALPFSGGLTPEALADQVRVSTMRRKVMVKHFPHMRESLNSLPELDKV